jgi:hypothetical protein
MSKGIPGCLLIITESEITLRVYEELMLSGAPVNTPALIFSILSLGNFSYKNENAVPFLSSVLPDFS